MYQKTALDPQVLGVYAGQIKSTIQAGITGKTNGALYNTPEFTLKHFIKPELESHWQEPMGFLERRYSALASTQFLRRRPSEQLPSPGVKLLRT